MESENPTPPKIQRFKNKKVFLLIFLVILVPLAILVALTKQNLQQFADVQNSESLDKVLEREQMLVADQMYVANDLDKQIQEVDSANISKMNPSEKQNALTWNAEADKSDIQKEKSLMQQANSIQILPEDTLTDKLQKNTEKLNLVLEVVKKKQKRVEKKCKVSTPKTTPAVKPPTTKVPTIKAPTTKPSVKPTAVPTSKKVTPIISK